MQDLVADFAFEAAEALAGLQAGLVRLAADPSDAAAAEAMLRRLHGLKGTCAFLGFSRAEALAHAGESVLATFPAASSSALVALGRMIQALGELVDRAVRDQAEPEGDDGELIAALEGAARRRAAKGGPAAPVLLELTVPPQPEGERRAPAPWAGLDVLVRALGDRLGKRIELAIGGDDVRVAPEAAPGLRIALIALIRNACDHGVEGPAERRAAAKPALSILRLSLHRSAQGLTLELADDGRGLDVERLRGPHPQLSETDALARVFQSGVTTAPAPTAPTALSGRGVGLSLVRREVEALGGAVGVASVPGRGARFVLDLPAAVLATPAARSRPAA